MEQKEVEKILKGVQHSKADAIEKEDPDILQLVCFKLADEEYAVKITKVKEVLRIQKITPVPQMPDFTLGVINIRGHIIPVFDLRKRFHLEEKELDETSKLLVASTQTAMIGIIVDEILDNIKIASSQINPTPIIQLKIDKKCIFGIASLENRMIIIMDLEKLHEDILNGINTPDLCIKP